MSTFEFTVDCAKEVGDLPALSQAVMGNMSYNLLRIGVRLQKTLEGISEQPLCRRIMCPLSTGTGIDKGTGVYRERADGTPVYDFTILDQILACMISPRSVPFFGVAFMPEDLSGALELATEGDESAQDLPPEAKVQAARARRQSRPMSHSPAWICAKPSWNQSGTSPPRRRRSSTMWAISWRSRRCACTASSM